PGKGAVGSLPFRGPAGGGPRTLAAGGADPGSTDGWLGAGAQVVAAQARLGAGGPAYAADTHRNHFFVGGGKCPRAPGTSSHANELVCRRHAGRTDRTRRCQPWVGSTNPRRVPP